MAGYSSAARNPQADELRPLRLILLFSGLVLLIASAVAMAAALRGAREANATRSAGAATAAAKAAIVRVASRAAATPHHRPARFTAPAAGHAAAVHAPAVHAAAVHAAVVDAAAKPPAHAIAREPHAARHRAGSAPQAARPVHRPVVVAAAPAARERVATTGTVASACDRALAYEKTAASAAASAAADARVAYDATTDGLAVNASCDEPQRRLLNEAYLLSMRAPAEQELRVGDWFHDLTRANTLLRECAMSPEWSDTQTGRDCRTQQRFNALTADRIAAWGTLAKPTTTRP